MGATTVAALTSYLGAATGGATLTAGSAAVAAGAINVVGGAAVSYGLQSALKPKLPAMPPSPFMPQATVDQDVQNAEADARRRQGTAGGIDSTVGAGQGGMLNPSSMSTKTLLGQ